MRINWKRDTFTPNRTLRRRSAVNLPGQSCRTITKKLGNSVTTHTVCTSGWNLRSLVSQISEEFVSFRLDLVNAILHECYKTRKSAEQFKTSTRFIDRRWKKVETKRVWRRVFMYTCTEYWPIRLMDFANFITVSSPHKCCIKFNFCSYHYESKILKYLKYNIIQWDLLGFVIICCDAVTYISFQRGLFIW